ncbi:MAG: hypothetical protein CXZ00_13190 [Acidobacteria bacterium]|nr:MAG: hypothetical protein CXZ00_13190 [Acidobacteriota bacterium]
MPSPTVVIAQNDPDVAQELANDLHAHFARIVMASGVAELRALLLRHEARLAVLDVDLIDIDEIRELANTFYDLTIVCTHRSPDERMWMAALNAGAAEFCLADDIRSILKASRKAEKHRMEIAA